MESTRKPYLYKFITYPVTLFLYLIGFCYVALYVAPPTNMMLYEGLVKSESDYMLIMPMVCAIDVVLFVVVLLGVRMLTQWFNDLCREKMRWNPDRKTKLLKKKTA